MEFAAALLMGISLAACAGLRAFLPLFAVGLATRMEWWPVQSWFEWIGTNEALITFGVATVLEIAADKVPLLDHALDTFHTFARPVAGALVAVGALHQLPPAYAVAAGIIVGAPIASAFHFTRAGTRLASTATTAGFANPVLSVIEDVVAFFGVVLALLAPVLAAAGIFLVGLLIRRQALALQARRRRSPAVPSKPRA